MQMNRRLFISISLMLLLLLVPVNADASNILKIGMNGQQVVELKQNLNKLGYFSEANISNEFDELTKAAVKKFQEEYSITVDGIVGGETQKIIKIALAQKEIIENGKPIEENTELSDRGAIIRLTTTANKYAGVRYVSGGSSPKGFDCSGFTQYVYKQSSISIDRTPRDQFNQGIPIAKSDLQAGDLVFFRKNKSDLSRIQHVGIYLGDDKFIHASSTKHKVVVANFNEYCGWSNYAGARRFVIR